MPDATAIKLHIEKLVAGGDGLAFLDGKAVFVPFTLPGEIDMHDHPDFVHVTAGTIREKVRRMVASRLRG